MVTKKVYFDKCAAISYANQDTHYTPADTHSYDLSLNDYLLVKTTASIADIEFRSIQKFLFYLHASAWDASGTTCRETMEALKGSFDENTVTFASSPGASFELSVNFYKENVPGYSSASIPLIQSRMRDLLFHGARIVGQYVEVSTPNSTNKPYVEIECSEENAGVACEQTYPVGAATISRVLPTTFSWKNSVEAYDTITEVALSSTKFRWRYSGNSSYTEYDAGTNTSYTVPENTFSSGTIEWQVETTANSGAVRTTPWTAVSVTEPLSAAAVIAPKNAVVDGTADITFRWEHIISSGTRQTAYDLQTSPDGKSWTTLRTASTADTFVTIPANTFTAGDLYWRVRTYNLDNTAGEWSETAHFIVIAAPGTPGVTVEAAEPQFRIRWQQQGQQAYEIRLDGQVIARGYGTESNYRYDGYLKPGAYEIEVRIQNQYGLWSDWGVLVLAVENVSGAAIELTATGDNVVQLSWTGQPEYSKYIVYRDGVKLGETTETEATDHFALGAVTYEVRGVYADSGNYTLSNAVDLVIEVPEIMIADTDDPEWLSLAKSTSSLRSTSLSAVHSVSYAHYSGKALPRAEIGEAVDKSYQIDCAWPIEDTESAAAFEALAGKVVCIKTPSLRRIIGVMGSWSATENPFWVSYTAPITLIDWDDRLLPKKKQGSEPDSQGSAELVALIEDELTRITSSANRVRDYVFYYSKTLNIAYFPNALMVGVCAFAGCSVLEAALFPSAIELHSYAFQDCEALKTVSFPKATSIGDSAFHVCHSLTEIVLPSAVKIGSFAFIDCIALSKVDLGNVTAIYERAFRYCEALETLIIRTKGFCELIDERTFDDTPIQDGTGYIYVPSAQVAAYKADAVWSTYAAQIRAIEDYPEITGG